VLLPCSALLLTRLLLYVVPVFVSAVAMAVLTCCPLSGSRMLTVLSLCKIWLVPPLVDNVPLILPLIWNWIYFVLNNWTQTPHMLSQRSALMYIYIYSLWSKYIGGNGDFYLLQYASLLEYVKKCVLFVRDAADIPNPAMDANHRMPEMREQCPCLSTEICQPTHGKDFS
jgi:hypothetical protein